MIRNSMFKVKQDKLGRFDRYTIANITTNEKVVVIPEFGANIMEIVLSKNSKLFSILDGDTGYNELLSNCCYKGAKLIPFPNRINNGEYKFGGGKHKLYINQKDENNAIHGLVYNKPFIVNNIIESKSAATLNLEYSYNSSNEGFPFSFELILQYTLSNNGLDINTSVVNTGYSNMPFGDGWHPYFRLNRKVDDLYLQIPSNKRIIIDSRMIPTGKIITDERFEKINKIGSYDFDDGYIIEGNNRAVTKIVSIEENVAISVWQDSDYDSYNFLQIYIPPHRNSIAIEPMTCKTDAFNNNDGLIILKPNHKFKGSYGVFLS